MATATEELHTGLSLLEYRFMPTSAFGPDGNLRFPEDMSVPESWTRTAGRIATEPAWRDLFNILGILTVPKTAWTCWKVAIGFYDGHLRVIIAKPITGVGGNPDIALNWSNNLWSSVLAKLNKYAGTRYLFPTGLADAASGMAEVVKNSRYWEKEFPDNSPDEKKNEVQRAKKAQFFELKWRVTSGADLLGFLFKVLGSVTLSGRVLSTVLWYDPNRPTLPASALGYWKPLHQVYDAWQNRSIHYWWNSGCRIPKTIGRFSSYPFVSSSEVKQVGWPLTPVAHRPWELCAALYPDGDWPIRAVSIDGNVMDLGDVQLEPISGPSGGLVHDLVAPTTSTDPSIPAGLSVDNRAAPVTAAHELPKLGGDFLCLGTLLNSEFTPTEDVQLPETIWLPSEGVLAATGGNGRYVVAGQLPTVCATTGALGVARNRPFTPLGDNIMDSRSEMELPEVKPIDVTLESVIDTLELVEVDDDAMWVAHGEILDTPDVIWTYPRCPNPTKWTLVRQAKARGQFKAVSAAVIAKAAPIRYTFTVQRSVTFSAAVTAGVKVSVPLLEQETGIKLETSVTVSIGESLAYTVPKGQTMALFAGAGFIVREFQRVVYGSAMCNKVVQRTQVTSPYIKIFEVRNI